MDWRTSDVEKRSKTEVDRDLAAGNRGDGSLAFIALIDRAADLARGAARLRLGPALVGDLQMARRAGQRFGLNE
jgi:hypothetical protein